MPDRSAPASRRPRAAAPSDYVRLEADLAGTRAIWVSRSAPEPTERLVVVVAEADAVLRAHVAEGLRERLDDSGFAFHVSAVGSFDALAARLRENDVDVVICGHLDGLPGGVPSRHALAEAFPQLRSSLFVMGKPDAVLGLRVPGSAVRLCAAAASLLERGPPAGPHDPPR